MKSATSDLRQMTGGLVLVVGPSGAGKDTLLAGARRRLHRCAKLEFQPLDITRPRHHRRETHNPVTESEFEDRLAAGLYALSWRANGFGYGLPRRIDQYLASGRFVVAAGSRATIGVARSMYPTLRVILIAASDAIVRQRLTARGRETADEADSRLQRSPDLEIDPQAVTVINNEGSAADGVSRLVAVLISLISTADC